jgi:osmotically inducible protein OsmC
MSTVFTTKVTATGGRNGHVKSEDGVIDFDVRLPKEMGGSGGAYTNPEQLFAAGYAACFDSSIAFASRMMKVNPTSSVTAAVGLQRSEQALDLQVELDVQLDGVDKETAERVIELAYSICPYSRALNKGAEVKINLLVGEAS